MSSSRTRLAPSPTGALHLGNARTFLVNWAMARQNGWKIVLRIEDLDGPRIKANAAKQAIDILQWLGLDWDEGPCYQTDDLAHYESALERLVAQGDIYPCRCTRKQIEAASLSAPQKGDHELRYPGTCRQALSTAKNQFASQTDSHAWRILVPPGTTTFVDTFAGAQIHDVQQSVGDFLVRTKVQLPCYQLAVVVDDARQGINQVVRGDDLLNSVPRQLLLYNRLHLSPTPTYTHLPMVIGADGRRLAKRHGDSRLQAYRNQGTRAERIVGLLAEWCGLGPRREMTAKEFSEQFTLGRLSPDPVVFRRADDSWLVDAQS
ncbi:MAG: tRNA glutamyl-Q(34) synthetase GluQRS [Pirellulales bacterium]|nr:tRNA glutamyl-Q(34) synthetase GluQRS [Pirellulales bacterium]